MHVELLLEGNTSAQEASDLARLVIEILPMNALPLSKRPKQQIAEIPEDQSYLLRHSPFSSQRG